MEDRKLRNVTMQALKWVQTHARTVLGGLGVAVLLAAGAWFYNNSQRQKLEEASNLLYRAQEFYHAQFDQIKKEIKKDHPEELPQSFLELEKKYLTVITQFPKSAQAQIACLDLSRTYFDLGRIEQAQKVLEMVSFLPPLQPLVKMRQAFFSEEKTDYDTSKKMWQHVLSDQKYGSPFHGMAKVHLGRLEYLTQHADAGKKLIDEVIEKYSGKFEAVEAQKVRLFYE